MNGLVEHLSKRAPLEAWAVTLAAICSGMDCDQCSELLHKLRNIGALK